MRERDLKGNLYIIYDRRIKDGIEGNEKEEKV